MVTSGPRTNWSTQEIDLVVSDYFDMLGLEFAGTSFNRAERNRRLQELTGRSKGSIEFKRQNISAVLDVLGIPWLKGFVPRANFQNALLDVIELRLESRNEITYPMANRTPVGLHENSEIFFEQPPILQPSSVYDASDRLKFLIRKFDPAERDHKNRELGKLGEKLLFEWERARVEREHSGLGKSVKWISRDMGDGAGYDILSFDKRGKERFIEVKTTTGGQRTPFFISANEIAASHQYRDKYSLVRLYDFARTPKAFELLPPIENSVSLSATSYRALFEQ